MTMTNLIRKVMQILNDELTRYRQWRINTEYERQAMNCGAYNPRFLAKIKRSKQDSSKTKSKNL
jgi:hypothetical protein